MTIVPHQDDLLRQAMVEGQLKPNKIVCPRVIKAFMSVSRLPFCRDERITTSVYRDAAIFLRFGRVWLPPLVMAHMMQWADIKHHESVCVLGSSMGYMGALLHTYVKNVHVQDKPEHLFDERGLTPLENQHITIHQASPAVGPVAPADVVFVDGGEVESWPEDGWATRRTIAIHKNRIVCRETGSSLPFDVWLTAMDARLPEFRSQTQKDWLAASI